MVEGRAYEFRCPVHGFIVVDSWEREIIAHPAFQRLRRIRQLAWTDYIYSGAMHTRFEHSLGVMHLASRLFDAICQRSAETLETELGYNADGLRRDRRLVRLAALLHDVGHGPFSHASEDLFPINPRTKKRYEHDTDYSANIVQYEMADVIENHSTNKTNYHITAEEIAAIIEGRATAQTSVFWRELISGQMDADRMDYLLRDSLHAGVQYGRYDMERLIQTVAAIPGADGKGPRLGVSEGGWHAAESLILARYFMFTQVYFHRTRVAYDHHIFKALQMLLPGGHFPTAEKGKQLKEYLKWDDWRVLGLISSGKAGEHGDRLCQRNHYREVYHTPETPNVEDQDRLDRAREILGDLCVFEQSAGKTWYKTEKSDDIPVLSENIARSVRPLSVHSSVVKGIKPSRQTFLYATPEHAAAARNRLHDLE
jgi:uncharacterized protein